MKNFIPFALPDIDSQDIAEVVDTLRSAWITTGKKTKLFDPYIYAPNVRESLFERCLEDQR